MTSSLPLKQTLLRFHAGHALAAALAAARVRMRLALYGSRRNDTFRIVAHNQLGGNDGNSCENMIYIIDL